MPLVKPSDEDYFEWLQLREQEEAWLDLKMDSEKNIYIPSPLFAMMQEPSGSSDTESSVMDLDMSPERESEEQSRSDGLPNKRLKLTRSDNE